MQLFLCALGSRRGLHHGKELRISELLALSLGEHLQQLARIPRMTRLRTVLLHERAHRSMSRVFACAQLRALRRERLLLLMEARCLLRKRGDGRAALVDLLLQGALPCVFTAMVS